MNHTLGGNVAKNLFANLDLNLLRVFKVLFEELNMRKAAERLFVSQPAVSQSLQKLRHQFDDPLFVKVKTGLAPTSFAEKLAQELMPLLYDIENAVNSTKAFDPKELDEEITISLSSTFVFSVSGDIYRFFSQHAPGLRINIASWNDKTIESIEKGEVTLGVNAELAEDYPFLAKEQVSELTGNIIVRQGHPIVDKEISAKNLSQYRLARLLVSNYSKLRSPTVEIFERMGYELEVGFSSEFPVVLLNVIRHSDMFMGASNCFPIQEHPDLVLLEPDETVPGATYPAFVYYHQRHEKSEMMQWLVQSISEIFECSKSHNVNSD